MIDNAADDDGDDDERVCLMKPGGTVAAED